jgi:hypothetical protein
VLKQIQMGEGVASREAEELLQHDELAARRAVGRAALGRQVVTVTGGQNDRLFHHVLQRCMMTSKPWDSHRDIEQEKN